MSFTWDLYLDFAEELIEYQKTQSLNEAYFRTAISRSYYSVFCLSRNALIKKGILIPTDKSVHYFVIDKF